METQARKIEVGPFGPGLGTLERDETALAILKLWEVRGTIVTFTIKEIIPYFEGTTPEGIKIYLDRLIQQGWFIRSGLGYRATEQFISRFTVPAIP